VRSYIIEEMKPEYIESLVHYLEQKGYKCPLKDIYWFDVPEELLTARQKRHLPSCGPYIFSLEIGKTWVKLELLVRAQNIIRCNCITYATAKQRKYIIEYLDNILKSLDIPV